MTPERRAFIAQYVPTLADFQRLGPIIHITNTPGPTPTYELVMHLDGFTDMNKRLSPTLPAPEPLRSYEIVCEGEVFASGTY